MEGESVDLSEKEINELYDKFPIPESNEEQKSFFGIKLPLKKKEVPPLLECKRGKLGQSITAIIKHDRAGNSGTIEIMSARYIKRTRRGKRQGEYYVLANGDKVDPLDSGSGEYMDKNGRSVLFLRSPSPHEYTITSWDDKEIRTMTESTKKRVFYEMKTILDRRANRDWFKEASPFIFFLIFCISIIAMFKVSYPIIAQVEKEALTIFLHGGHEFNQSVTEFKYTVEALGAEVEPLIPPKGGG